MDERAIITLLWILSSGISIAAKRYYATESCGRVYGPEILTILEFDKDVEYNNRKPADDQDLTPPLDVRNTLWECVIVVKGLPSARVKKYIGIEWRHFHIRDPDINTVEQSVASCGKAYVTIYKGMTATKSVTMCGKDARQTFFEWEGNYLTFKFVVDFRRDPSWTTPVPPTPPPKDCVEPGDAKGDVTTLKPLCTTPKKSRKTTPVPDLYPYPEVYFRVDITSFDYACNKSIDQEVLRCNDSQRCLDASLMCDNFFSHNCMGPANPKDVTDQTRDAPAYCNRKSTTTPVPTTTTEPPPKPFPWKPVVAALGGILAVLLLLWCCWRPGYLPWRLARMRNVPGFNTQRCICCRGPTKCCSCLPCCSGGGEDTFVPVQYKRLNLPKIDGSRLQALQGRNKDGFPNGNPYGNRPNNNMSDGNMPPGYMPNGGMSPGYMPNGNYPPGYMPNGQLSPGYMHGGYMPSGGMPGDRSPGSGYQHHPRGRNYLAGHGNPFFGSYGQPPYRQPTYTCKYGEDPNNFATDWLKFISYDGGHLREQR